MAVDDEPAPEFRGCDIIAKAMSDDIPANIFKQFCESVYGNSPVDRGRPHRAPTCPETGEDF